jgi:hypothetical protein
LLHGFVMDPAARADIRNELRQTGDPIRRLVMEGVLVLGRCGGLGRLHRRPLRGREAARR